MSVVLCTASIAFASDGTKLPSPEDVRSSIEQGTAFLLSDQNLDGSWGSHRNAGWEFEFWSNPESHRSWIVATTGLACMTLLDLGHTDRTLAAYDRGISYILNNAMVKRPSGWDVDNTWAYVYGLQALAWAYADPRYEGTPQRERIRAMVGQLLERLAAYQTPSGGWAYYDFETNARRPSWATSFMTAAAVIAMMDAREHGIDVDERMLRRAVRAIRRCRLPSGAYTYSVETIPSPRHLEWIDQIKGSLGRIQVCNLALLRAGDPVSTLQLKTGLDHFFGEHRFLDVAYKKPYPHEAYYLNSGYFYFFGHYYAARVVERLPAEDRVRYWNRLQREVTKTQERDGSMWDFYFHSYHKPYGTAFGVMTLNRSVADTEAAKAEPNHAGAGDG